MALRYLLDTNICIYVRQRRPPRVLSRFAELKSGEAALSIVTYGELLYGIAKQHAPSSAGGLSQLEEFVSMIGVLPLTIDAGRSYGAVRSFLESRGQIIGSNDLWIASHALSANLTLVTNNEREFRRVPDLRIENWVD